MRCYLILTVDSKQELTRLWEKMRRHEIAKEDRAKYVPTGKVLGSDISFMTC